MTTHTTGPCARVTTRAAYRAEREHIFPSDSSLDWFIRSNRRALVEAKALLLIGGRVMVMQDAFDAALVGIGHAAVREVA